MSRSERVYWALLRAYPRSTRDASGDDMVQLFEDRLRDADTRRERAGVWLESVADIVVTAPRERLSRRRELRIAEGPPIESRRSVLPDFGVAALPLAITAFLMLAAPGYYSPFFDERVYLLGLQAGTSGLWMTAILAAIGILAARRRADLSDPMLQAVLIAALVAPTVFVFVLVPCDGLVYLAYAMTFFVLVARFRAVQVALVVPFLAWVLVGPWVVNALNALES